jgi:hypothetical protein
VISIRRSPSPSAHLQRGASRRLALLFGSTAGLLLAILLAAVPAGAFISGEFGLQQRKPAWHRSAPLQYHDGPVIHASDSYAIYWDPLELYNSQWMRIIDGYFRNTGEASGEMGNVFGLDAQYGETGYGTGPAASEKAKEAHAADQSTFRGAYTDTDSYPASGCTESAGIACLTDQQIRAELQKVIKSGALPGTTGTVPGAKTTPVYYILTPPGVTVCTVASSPSTCSNSSALETETLEIKEGEVSHPAETGICGYHSAINPHSASPIVYAVQPWIAGDAGLFTESGSPLTTSGTSAGVLACQNNKSLQEPNQIGYNPFSYYGAGLADVIVGDLANEQTNIVVDPLLNGWYQNAAPAENGDPEQGDMCQFAFSTGEVPAETIESLTHAGTDSSESLGSGSYYIHWGFNSSGFLTGKDTAGCWQGATLEPHITAPNPVNVGDVVGLDANESDITLDAAPLSLRVQKEETRLAEEVQAIDAEELGLTAEITKVGDNIAQLSGEITKRQGEITTLTSEIKAFEGEEKSFTTAEAELTKERREAEEKSKLTSTEEKEFAEKEERLAAKNKKAVESKASAEKAKKADIESKLTAERERRDDEEHKLVLEEDKVIVTGDKAIAEEEKKLADEHKLIKEREPLIAPIYKWDFGYQENGKEVTEEGEEKASVFHVFPCAKTYNVELTVVDGAGNESELAGTSTKTIEVKGKPCEEAGGSSSGGSGSGGSSGGSGSSGSSASPTSTTSNSSTTTGSAAPGVAAKPPLPGPVATAATVSKSLAQVLRSGLVVRYSVNEQVAGRFEVLLASSIAKRIGLHGAPAAGLPQGAAPQIVIAKAILVTTKGGRNTIKILLGKTTAARLRKLRKVSLMLRLIVRNASSQNPVGTTVISTVNLGR